MKTGVGGGAQWSHHNTVQMLIHINRHKTILLISTVMWARILRSPELCGCSCLLTSWFCCTCLFNVWLQAARNQLCKLRWHVVIQLSTKVVWKFPSLNWVWRYKTLIFCPHQRSKKKKKLNITRKNILKSIGSYEWETFLFIVVMEQHLLLVSAGLDPRSHSGHLSK